MARHFMAVCVVCLLCAENLPCEEHFEPSAPNDGNLLFRGINISTIMRDKSKEEKFIAKNHEPPQKLSSPQYTEQKGWTRDDDESIAASVQSFQLNDRSKRHAHHDHVHHSDDYHPQDPDSDNSRVFLKKLFQQFGNADAMSMNIIGFEKMMKQLKLYNLVERKFTEEYQSFSNSNTSNDSSQCLSSLELMSRIKTSPSTTTTESHLDDTKLITNGHRASRDSKPAISSSSSSAETTAVTMEYDSVNGGDHNQKTDSKRNDTAADLQQKQQKEYEQLRANTIINSEDMLAVCPILLYYLTEPTSTEPSGCIQSSMVKPNVRIVEVLKKESRLLVWIYASSSVLVVSLVGLLGVAVIPCMDRHFYQHAIQFLVALAVGTLAGDALLHLLPHSMMMALPSNNDEHTTMTYKGLLAVLGIIFFFITERALTMIAEWRKKIEKKEKPSSRVRVMRDPDSGSVNNSTAGDKQCKHKYSSYPYCYDEIAMDTKDDHHHHHHNNSNNRKLRKKSIRGETGDHNETADNLLSQNYGRTISGSFSVINKEDVTNPDDNTLSTNLDDTSIECDKDKSVVQEESYTIILREHETTHHGHSHKHGHVHSPPRSLSAVAWMVVMGDGLHNFTDGMAIGAAFSNNIAGGFSTAIAVFCHELPHELGDFAVLLKAGMSARKAVYYNVLSSVLSFMGMILGIVIGETPEVSAWVFACAAGMFIYIALVDMVPELTSTHNERCALSQCFLQLLGMCSGLLIMLLISLYENDFKNIFVMSDVVEKHHIHYNDNHHHQH